MQTKHQNAEDDIITLQKNHTHCCMMLWTKCKMTIQEENAALLCVNKWISHAMILSLFPSPDISVVFLIQNHGHI